MAVATSSQVIVWCQPVRFGYPTFFQISRRKGETGLRTSHSRRHKSIVWSYLSVLDLGILLFSRYQEERVRQDCGHPIPVDIRILFGRILVFSIWVSHFSRYQEEKVRQDCGHPIPVDIRVLFGRILVLTCSRCRCNQYRVRFSSLSYKICNF